VVLFLSGISMVNAAMTTQLALDGFAIDRIVFSPIAGGVAPAFEVSEVVVPSGRGQYLEAVFVRETADDRRLPSFFEQRFPSHGMIFPTPVEVAHARAAEPEERFWFPADEALLEAARKVAGAVEFERCVAADQCLGRPPVVRGWLRVLPAAK
jgi:adenosylhomocysteine nucleosidase